MVPTDPNDEFNMLDAEALEQRVRHHNHLYWDLAAPEISDADFDRLLRRLSELRPDSPALRELGPTAFGRVVEHARPMLSLDKAYSRDQLLAFVQTPKTRQRKILGPLMLTPKIDGVACSLRYNARGELVQAATRGDGRKGEDVSANARRVQQIPVHIDSGGLALEVRGELYLQKSRFAERFAADFVNARNLTAGTIKNKDPRRCAEVGLSFFAYELLGDDSLVQEHQGLRRLAELGFHVPPSELLSSEHEEALWQAVQQMGEMAAKLDCDTDGVVIKADDIAEQKRLGHTDHHPSYALAFKFQGETGISALRAVEWGVSRSGRITPVAVVDPVFLSGAMVGRASLHNLDILQSLQLGVGSRVELSRRGEVIPQIERALDAGREPVVIPERCPSCNSPTERADKFLYCKWPDACPDALVGSLAHFCKVLDIEGFGDKLLRALVSSGTVRQAVDFFALDREALLALRQSEGGEGVRMGSVLADKLIAAVRARRRVSLADFLTALGIEDLGRVMAEKMAAHWPDLSAVRALGEPDLVDIEGFGEERARSIVQGLRRLGPRIDALLKEIEIIAPEPGPISAHVLAGRSVVFTGKMATLDRKSAQARVRACGGRTPGNVTRELDILVVGDLGSPLLGEGKLSTKHKTADKYKAAGAAIEIITEAEFLRRLDEGVS